MADEERAPSGLRAVVLNVLGTALILIFGPFYFLSVILYLAWHAVVALLKTILLGLAPAALIVFLTRSVPFVLQVAVLLAATLWLVFLTIHFTRKNDDPGPWLISVSDGVPSPAERILRAVAILLMAVGVFAAATAVLADHHLVVVAGWETERNQGWVSVQFYLWHFLNSIPLLDVTRALRWDEPLAYEDGRLGAILVLFKLLIIIPIVGVIRGEWRATPRKPVKDKSTDTG